MNKFGEIIRFNREKQQMLLRHLSSKLDIDTGLLSKIERGEKIAKKENILKLSDIFSIQYEELYTLWLADKVYKLVYEEKNVLDALDIVKNEIVHNGR